MAVSVLTCPAQPSDVSGPLAVRAAVWGQVRNPGQYRLPCSPDLIELVSVAGGPLPDADLSRLTLIRERDGTRQCVDLRQLAASGSPLFLVPGDIVIVHGTPWSRIREGIPAVTAVVAAANVVITLMLLLRG